MLECYNWLFCNLIGDNRFSVILHKYVLALSPLPFYERVWLRQTIRNVCVTTRLGNLHREYNYWYARGVARFRDEDVQMALNKCAARAGYSLRPLQEQVISFVQGSDVFVGLPTGSGKSLCYNILPDVFNSLRKVKSSIDERPGTGTPHFMRLCLRAHAIDWC